ncbi:MAG: VOC family protein [Chloroflexi bacterium]|nr:VOC family protein [Chloroflexota bacterium]
MAFKVKHLHLKSPDPQKTAQWWVGNLGATIVSESASPTGTLQLDLGGITLNVSPFVEGQTRPQRYGLEHVAIGVPVDDLNDVLNKLKGNGARVLEESKNRRTGRTVFFIETPEGVQIEIMGED